MVVVSSVMLWPGAAVAAGETRARPQVQVVPPPSASSDALEPDDLPGPQPEVVTAGADVELPPVPSFDRPAPDGMPAVEHAATTSAVSEARSAVVTEPPLRKAVDKRLLQVSVDYLNACSTALNARRYDAAIAACRAATGTWDGNHLAWYGWAIAHMAKREWSQAQVAIEHAVALRPDQGMYQLYYGIALYEAERRQAREQARTAHKNPEAVTLDPAAPRIGAARAALVQATRLVPDLWRAHYYLGRVLRDAKPAAEQLTATIKMNPSYGPGYIALTELYRRWGYLEPSLAVATLGIARVAVADSADLWFEVGLSYDAMHAETQAIEAFGKAIAIRPDDASLKLYRGWLYVVAGDLAAARRDLADVTSSTDPTMDAKRQLAVRLLAYIASGGLPQGDSARTCSAVKACSVFVPDRGWMGDDWASRL